MNFGAAHDFNSQIATAPAADNSTATAGGTGDGTQVTGLAIDRLALNSPLSVAFLIRYKAVLTAAKTINFATLVETASDAAFTSTQVLQNNASAVVDTGAAGGSTQRGVVRVAVDLAGALQYVRLKYTPDLSATATDTVEADAVAVFGGEQTLPA